MAPCTRRMSKKMESDSERGANQSSSSDNARTISSRLTRNKAPLCKVEYYGNESTSSITERRPMRSKKGHVLTATRKQIILRHLNQALGTEFRGMEILKRNLLAALRKANRGPGKVTIEDLNRWLDNPAFVLLLNSLKQRQARERQPQLFASFVSQFTDRSNSVPLDQERRTSIDNVNLEGNIKIEREDNNGELPAMANEVNQPLPCEQMAYSDEEKRELITFFNGIYGTLCKMHESHKKIIASHREVDPRLVTFGHHLNAMTLFVISQLEFFQQPAAV